MARCDALLSRSDVRASGAGLDPVWRTPDERRIRCPPWLRNPRSGVHAGASLTSSRPGRFGSCSTRARPPQVARDLDLTESALRSWTNQARADRNKGKTGLTTAEREELAKLRKEVRELRMERDILKEAAAGRGLLRGVSSSAGRSRRPTTGSSPCGPWRWRSTGAARRPASSTTPTRAAPTRGSRGSWHHLQHEPSGQRV